MEAKLMMKHPINTWTKAKVEYWRKQSICSGKTVSFVFTAAEQQQAKAKLETLYSSRVYLPFVEKILLLQEIY